ncbi:FAD-binding domain-containing protein [Gloeocapsa sp. PCC 73106]|uniref:FAD-binding domain-containing protein n=1 Tax=Gloeocapsa sp. PCC 73106 TaxID=102232 RepID=UPI0002ABF3C5|nr:FAD-binding domain-containing protein [Gloeocapsa sp. PCC 73106]ELR99572.1 deoxyribodipyrimidine photolyase [Gloeocapsa sp. PCC 73106]
MSDLIIFWHRRDLRVSDNLGLSLACSDSSRVIGCFCFDLDLLSGDDIAPARISYLIGCLQLLQAQYQERGGELLLLRGKPTEIIPRLGIQLQARGVYWNLDVEPYAKERDRLVQRELEQQKIVVKTVWDQLLQSPGQVLTKSGDPYQVYTPFWKNWSQHTKSSPVAPPALLHKITENELTLVQELVLPQLPSSQELGYSYWDYPLPLKPGEIAAKQRLSDFCSTAIEAYQEQRNFPAIEGTSQLSGALKLGAIGIRTVWQETMEIQLHSCSIEGLQGIQTWQQELCWREFYQHALYFFPDLATGPYRESFKDFPWQNNPSHFQAWCEGNTGYPIVDAAMRQLNQTGWMHNRCRMIVASFLTKDLLINWQWGEKYFMQNLYDGDLSANNGGWQWSASSGMDPKPLRIFNPASQAQKFDPEAEYIRQWLPELSSVDTIDLVTGKITPWDCHQLGYPQPIVNHQQQQREFKRLYSNSKNNG